MFLSSILTNILIIIIAPNYQVIGASTAVYAVEGIVIGYSLKNIVPTKFSMIVLRQNFSEKEKKNSMISNLMVFVILFSWLILMPDQFLAKADGVSVFSHAVGFLFGFIFAYFANYFYSLSKYIKN